MSKVQIIAEMSANHCGDINIAKKIIESAKTCGADAIKIQTYTAEKHTLNFKNDIFTLNNGSIWDGTSLYDLYKEAYTPWEWHSELKKHADEVGIVLFSAPCDKTAVDFLEQIEIPIYKIGSFEAVDIPLIEYTASKGKPMIISTGIINEEEIKETIDACKKVGNNQITLLKCTSAYPAKLGEMNLLTIPNMKQKFQTEVGLSDHTMNIETVITAVALGAKVIEKHFTLDRELGGADATFSLNPKELKATVEAIRNTEKLLGSVSYDYNRNNRQFARSLFVCEDINQGEVFTETNLRSIRPSNGIAPKYLPNILGKKAACNLKKGVPLQFEMFE